MKKIIKICLIVTFLIIGNFNNTNAQQWSSEQKDVWAGIEKYWEISTNNDADGFLSYFDESYIGWSYQSKVPQSKSNTAKWIKNDFKNNTTILYTLTPISIWVKGNFAFANYFYSQLNKNKKTGKDDPTTGKWTDILMKKNGKWMLVGDHGGRTSKKK